MQLISALSAALLALPLVHGQPLEKRDVPCDPIAKYSTDFFMQNRCKLPPPSTCLFYTFGLSERAKEFSKSGGADMTTIWEMWPSDLYNDNVDDKNNPIRCIIKDPKLRTTYFENMSRAMALSCSNFATVMTPDIDNIPQAGIWGRVEFPTLKSTRKVDTVAATTPDGKNVKIIWQKSNLRRDEADQPEEVEEVEVEEDLPQVDTLVERATCGTSNNVAADFDAGGKFPVPW